MIDQLLVYRHGIGVVQSGNVVQLTQGDLLQVTVSFSYRCHENAVIHLRGSIGDPSDPAAQGRQGVTLPASEDVIVKTSYVNIQTSTGGIIANATLPGTYDITVSVDESPSVSDTVSACVTVVKAAGMMDTIMSIMPFMLMIMVMGMIMPAMQGTAGGEKSE